MPYGLGSFQQEVCIMVCYYCYIYCASVSSGNEHVCIYSHLPLVLSHSLHFQCIQAILTVVEMKGIPNQLIHYEHFWHG